ncbi:hypothetical protein X740_02525 [Mesorhizobium sp. LNHC221B00]|nr:hypothetical protein X740_02525 [Mesorhizobium sp. LNHC221B00]
MGIPGLRAYWLMLKAGKGATAFGGDCWLSHDVRNAAAIRNKLTIPLNSDMAKLLLFRPALRNHISKRASGSMTYDDRNLRFVNRAGRTIWPWPDCLLRRFG